MDIFMAYIATFFIIFIMMPLTYFALRLVIWLFVHYCGLGTSRPRDHQQNPSGGRRLTFAHIYDRQGNIFTIADDTQNSTGPHRCTDFFYVETSGDDAARIRAQLEKDDKDLPSYEEVMSLSVDTLPAVPPRAAIGASNASIATTDTMLMVPPYSEIDPNAITGAPTTAAPRPAAVIPLAAVPPPAIAADDSPPPSTSRAAASNSTVALTISNVVSNTSV